MMPDLVGLWANGDEEWNQQAAETNSAKEQLLSKVTKAIKSPST
jgi:hypothetical protein